MINTKKEIHFPTEEWELELGTNTFIIKPISKEERIILNELSEMGATVRMTPNDTRPTSIFVSYDELDVDIESYNYNVIGIELHVHLHLLGNYGKYMPRLERFKKDMISSMEKNDLPSNGTLKRVEYVQVINHYEY